MTRKTESGVSAPSNRPEVRQVPLKDIRPYERNPRRNDQAVDAVAASIREFGFKVPIVIDRDGVIVAGHTRYKAAGKLKLKEVPVIVADDLTEDQIKAFRLADNRTGELAEWDDALLVPELDDIIMDMTQFGFEDDGGGAGYAGRIHRQGASVRPRPRADLVRHRQLRQGRRRHRPHPRDSGSRDR